jgi:hypothetical protein
MRRLAKAAGWEAPTDISRLRQIIETGYDVYHAPPECEVEVRVVDPRTLLALFHKCPVMEKVEKGGGMKNYHCACPLSFEGWTEAFGIRGQAVIEQGPEQGPPCRVRVHVRWDEDS